MKRDEVLDAVERERRRLFAAVDALGARAATLSVTDEGWTAKDVLAHCIHWVGQIAWGLGAPLTPAAYVTSAAGRPSEEEWNALAVAHHEAHSLDEVRTELERGISHLVERLTLKEDADMLRTDLIPWSIATPLWKQIGSETFSHWPGHAEDIERAAKAGV